MCILVGLLFSDKKVEGHDRSWNPVGLAREIGLGIWSCLIFSRIAESAFKIPGEKAEVESARWKMRGKSEFTRLTFDDDLE